jgi:transposase
VHQVVVPWARPEAGFTLLFEALLMAMMTEMPVKSVAGIVGENDTRLWRVLHHYIGTARDALSMAEVTSVGLDETSARRGHDYISLFVDLAARRVLYATEGKDAATLGEFAKELCARGGDPAKVTNVCCDMSQSFIEGVGEHLPNAEITFDRYHVAQIINKAVDEVRRQEQSSRSSLLARTRYLWLKNPKNLTAKQTAKLEYLLTKEDVLYTVRAYRWRLQFDAFFEQPPELAEAYLEQWCKGAARSGLLPFKGVVRTIRQHWAGILRWHTTRMNNGILEGINSLVQAAKRKARGYRTKANLIAMVYLIAGKLDLALTHTK